MTFWFLSFVDPDRPKGDRWVGGCIMIAGCGGKEGLKHAMEGAWLFGCNPGGEVMGTEIPEVPVEWVGRLMNREQCDAFFKEFPQCSAQTAN